MPKVSIIIPVYRVEKYLHQCLNSILNQSFTDWECILVDDGSPDKSGLICDQYAQKDNRVHVIHKLNGGVSSARNAALCQISGEWVTFVDADDCLYPQAIERWIAVAETNQLDLIQSSFNREYIEGLIDNQKTDVLTPMRYAESGVVQTCVGGTLFKVSIILEHCLRFNERVRLGEDQIFLFNFMAHCTKVQRIGDVLYFYRNNEQSAVNNPKTEYWLETLKAFKELKNTNPVASRQCDNMFLDIFTFLSIDTDLPMKDIVKIFSDVTIRYCKPDRNYASRTIFYLYRFNLMLTIIILRFLNIIRGIYQIHCSYVSKYSTRAESCIRI